MTEQHTDEIPADDTEDDETGETVSRETDDDPERTDEPGDGDGETFPRAYVESLRGESRRYRERAQSAEARTGDLAAALWRERVAATDRLADPDDLPLPEDTDPLDAEAVSAAVDALLERKPHLAARRARGDLGQHERRDTAEPVNLASILRANT